MPFDATKSRPPGMEAAAPKANEDLGIYGDLEERGGSAFDIETVGESGSYDLNSFPEDTAVEDYDGSGDKIDTAGSTAGYPAAFKPSAAAAAAAAAAYPRPARALDYGGVGATSRPVAKKPAVAAAAAAAVHPSDLAGNKTAKRPAAKLKAPPGPKKHRQKPKVAPVAGESDDDSASLLSESYGEPDETDANTLVAAQGDVDDFTTAGAASDAESVETAPLDDYDSKPAEFRGLITPFDAAEQTPADTTTKHGAATKSAAAAAAAAAAATTPATAAATTPAAAAATPRANSAGEHLSYEDWLNDVLFG